MKKLSFFGTSLILCVAFTGISNHAQAQLWNKIKNEVKNRAENHAVRKSGDATDAAMDKTEKEIGKSIGGNNNTSSASGENNGDNSLVSAASGKSVTSNYKSYDFVPGDKIIFQPDMSNEADAELPARFILKKGNAEIQSYEGEKILHLDKGGRVIVAPLMSNDDYLPEQFTMEFDMMYENERNYFAYVNDMIVRFYAKGDENFEGYGLYEFNIISNSRTSLGSHSASGQQVNEVLNKALNTNNVWHHIAIYVRKNIAKAYINEYRVNASNTMPLNATKVAIVTDGHYGIKIKNLRIAAGGDDKYNKIVTDGKFITHGILFDVNKSIIKPESTGTLNEIARLMKDHSDLKFEIDGHTDSDGNADSNMKLSQDRADAVKARLVEMGVAASRLTTKGFGATKPVDKNDSAEGKANNRRVEFVKI